MDFLRHVAQFERDFRVLGWRFAIEGTRSYFARRGDVVVDMGRFGNMYVRRSTRDFAVIRQVISNGEYDLAPVQHADLTSTARYEEIIASGKVPVIVDAGANIGAATIWFKHRFPDAVVVAIEPDPDNVKSLRRNLAGRGGTVVMEAAIGSTAGFASMNPIHSSAGGQTERAETGIRIVTMDDAVSQVPGGELFIAKIDIEGFESDLFAQNLDWLDRVSVIMIEPHDWMLPDKHTSASFQHAIGAREFDMLIRGENLIYIRRVP